MANSAPNIFSASEGIVTTRVGAQGTVTYRNAIQADGKIVVAGQVVEGGTTKIALLRYTPDGALDLSFGNGGKVVTSGGVSDAAVSVLIQPDGKILVLSERPGPSGSGAAFGVLRYNPDGSLDTSFSGDGSAVVDFNFALDDEHPTAMALQADGKIIVVGTATIAGDEDFVIARLNADGTLDTSFSGDGKASFNFNGVGSDKDRAYAVAVQADGKIVVLGTMEAGGGTGFDFGVVRFNANGSVDTSFSRTFGGYDNGHSVVLQPDGKIVVAGSTDGFGSQDFALARLNSDGSLDSTFNSSANVITSFGGADVALSVVLQPDGKILVGGYGGAGLADFALARYNSNGTPDLSFSGDGKMLINIGTAPTLDTGYSVTLQADGKIVVSGFSIIYGAAHSVLVRVNADGTLDTTFGATTYVEDAAPVVIDHDVSLMDTELAPSGNYDGASVLLTRSGGPNAEDVFSGKQYALNQGGAMVVNGTNIGTVTTNSGGALQIAFNAFATQQLVELALQQVAYSNSSNVPPASVTLTWTLSDGDESGSLSATADTVIHITSVNDAPVITSNGGGATAGVAVVENTTFVTTLAGYDVDGAFAFSLAGADAGRFVLSGNQLHFASKADFDTRTDANRDGIYDVTIVASDGVAVDTQALAVSLIDVPGNKVNGTSGNDKIDKSHKIKGKGATAENDKLDGKAGNDAIKGGGDNDTLIGGAGNDTLTGNAGTDRFVFKDKLLASNIDLITDFKHDIDVIALDDKVFKAIGTALEAKEFYAKAGAMQAHDKSDRIVYDTLSGRLYYDEDGNKVGGKGAIHFATLDKHPGIDAGDFLVV